MRNTFVIIFLILVSFGLGFSIDKEALVKSFEPEEEVSENLEEIPTGPKEKTKEYKSPFGFSFEYEDEMQLENTAIVLPPGYRVSAVAAVRYVEEQYCGASGLPEHCRAFLENPGIAFGVAEIALESLKENQLKDYLDFIEPITLSEKEGFQYYAGVEGEGVVTIALPLKEEQTLLIQYTFDELFDFSKPNSDVYGSEEQKAVVDKILSTLKFD